MSNPPENVRILEDHVCLEEDRVMIPFCLANSDRTDEIGEDPEKDRLFQPPESISADCWGAPVFLSYVAFNHFEATEPLRVKEELPA